MSTLDEDLRAWVAEERIFLIKNSADSILGVAQRVIAEFFKSYPAHENTDLHAQNEMLAVMANQQGFDHPVRWLGQCVCQGDGSMVFTTNVKPRPAPGI